MGTHHGGHDPHANLGRTKKKGEKSIPYLRIFSYVLQNFTRYMHIPGKVLDPWVRTKSGVMAEYGQNRNFASNVSKVRICSS